RQQAFEIQAINTLIVVPNRELALQLNQWAESILSLAYADVPRGKIVQCFVGGEGYDNKQRRYLKRHGMPAIVIGTPKTLKELICNEGRLKIRAPSILQQLKPQQGEESSESSAEFIKRLEKVHTISKREFDKTEDIADGLRGLRRLVIDEIDQVLRIPSQRASEKEKRLPNSNVRRWMQRRGWMSSRPLIMGEETSEESNSSQLKIPAGVTHYCLVIENGELVRNIRAKEEASTNDTSGQANQKKQQKANDEEDDVWETDVLQRTEEEQISAMEVMAEAASNCLAAMQPQGTVLIFTRSDASTTKFARVLEQHGVLAHDIMVHVDPELSTRVSQHIKESQQRNMGSQYHQPFKVFIATEEAARGIDVRDTSLVLILDIPKSAASYAHMSGRTGRFGRVGSVVSVVPVGKLGWYESKMRGIFALLNITPARAPFVES
ncbi:hypothetical protein IWW36_002633, partial [Coemansia brasiliensis]